jgi:transcriptional regulator with XRE-family HTH domain
MEDVKVRFGKRVRSLRMQKGWSQETMASIADIDRTYLPGIESGRRNVSLVILEKIAIAFEISLSNLLGEI